MNYNKKNVIINDNILQSKIDAVDINDINLDDVYLHYTNSNNLDNITKKGLKPKKSINSKIVEKTKKVFFSIGDKGALVLMDVWIKWLIAKPKCNLIYWIGAYLLKFRFFPKIIHEIIISNNRNNKKKCNWSFKKLKNILDNSVYLVLNLEENVDFSSDDIDEVKAFSKYPIKYIESIYALDSNPINDKIEYWNMHTFTNKVIEANKILLLKCNDCFKASTIIKHLIENNLLYVQKNCKNLYNYYNYIYIENRISN